MNENNMENTVDTREAKIEEIKTKFKFGGKFGKIATTAITGVALATGGALAQDQPTKTNLENTQEITCPTPDESIENIAASLTIPQKDSEPICFNVVFGIPDGYPENMGVVLSSDKGTFFIAQDIGDAESTDPENFSLGLLLWILAGVDAKDTHSREERMDFDKLVDWVMSKTHEERLQILQSFGWKGLVDDENFVPITDLNILLPAEIQ